MIATLRSARVRCSLHALPLAAMVLAIAGAGCGKVGCFEWTVHEGECPSQEEALAYFGSTECSGEVASVDSEPEYDGKYCCYDITKRDYDDYPACTAPPSGDRASPPPSP